MNTIYNNNIENDGWSQFEDFSSYFICFKKDYQQFSCSFFYKSFFYEWKNNIWLKFGLDDTWRWWFFSFFLCSLYNFVLITFSFIMRKLLSIKKQWNFIITLCLLQMIHSSRNWKMEKSEKKNQLKTLRIRAELKTWVNLLYLL